VDTLSIAFLAVILVGIVVIVVVLRSHRGGARTADPLLPPRRLLLPPRVQRLRPCHGPGRAGRLPPHRRGRWIEEAAWMGWEAPRNCIAGEASYGRALSALTGPPCADGYCRAVVVRLVRDAAEQVRRQRPARRGQREAHRLPAAPHRRPGRARPRRREAVLVRGAGTTPRWFHDRPQRRVPHLARPLPVPLRLGHRGAAARPRLGSPVATAPAGTRPIRRAR
jgi:hypothetical protein